MAMQQMLAAVMMVLVHLKQHLSLMMQYLWWLSVEACHLKVLKFSKSLLWGSTAREINLYAFKSMCEALKSATQG